MRKIRTFQFAGIGEISYGKTWATFQGMSWPRIGEDVEDLGERARYGTLSEDEQLVVASIIRSYIGLIDASAEKLRLVRKALQAVECDAQLEATCQVESAR